MKEFIQKIFAMVSGRCKILLEKDYLYFPVTQKLLKT